MNAFDSVESIKIYVPFSADRSREDLLQVSRTMAVHTKLPRHKVQTFMYAEAAEDERESMGNTQTPWGYVYVHLTPRPDRSWNREKAYWDALGFVDGVIDGLEAQSKNPPKPTLPQGGIASGPAKATDLVRDIEELTVGLPFRSILDGRERELEEDLERAFALTGDISVVLYRAMPSPTAGYRIRQHPWGKTTLHFKMKAGKQASTRLVDFVADVVEKRVRTIADWKDEVSDPSDILSIHFDLADVPLELEGLYDHLIRLSLIKHNLRRKALGPNFASLSLPIGFMRYEIETLPHLTPSAELRARTRKTVQNAFYPRRDENG